MWRGLLLPLIFFVLRCLNVYIRKQMYGDYAVKPSYISFKCFNYSTPKFVNKEIFAVSKLRLLFHESRIESFVACFVGFLACI